MSIWLRFLRESVALGLVAGFLATPVGLAHPGGMQHDPCDDIVVPAATGEGDRLTASVQVSAHGHCFTCHWFQSFRTSFTSGPSVTLDAAQTAQVLVCAWPVHDQFASLLIAPRAPPAG